MTTLIEREAAARATTRIDGCEFDPATPEQPPLLVLENLPGATLGYLLETETRLGSADIGHLGRHICSALRYLHGLGYLHLDVKPSNIIASHGVAKLIDLDLARPAGMTRGGRGTLGHMSPEQVSGGHLNTAADVWGLGLVLHQGATGANPFSPDDPSPSAAPAGFPVHGTSTSEHEDAARRDRFRELLDKGAPKLRGRRRLSPPVADVIDACLRREPTSRPTLIELESALADLIPPRPPGGPR